MKITEGNVARRVLIGLHVRVLRHPDPGLEGLEGKVVWETARTIVVRTVKGQREKDVRVLKDGALLEIEAEGRKFYVEGFRLLGRPEERVRRG